MTLNDYEVQNKQTQLKKEGVLKFQTHDALLAQNKLMTQ